MSALEAAAAIDDLFRRAVESPADIHEATLTEWMAEAAEALGPPGDKEGARTLRRAARLARKLAAYWQQGDPRSLPDWRNGVDEALGSRGWEPQLDLVKSALEAEPDPALFAEVGNRYRAVHFQPWMEGITFEEWLEKQ